MGGTFAMFMALHHPDLVAASFVYVPKLLFNYTPDASPVHRASRDRLWVTIGEVLPGDGAGALGPPKATARRGPAGVEPLAAILIQDAGKRRPSDEERMANRFGG